MAPLSDASPIRVALIDDDSGLLTVLERRLGALRWEIEVLAFPPDTGHLSAMHLHALIVNPRLTGLEYVERVADALPGLALLVCSAPVTVSVRVRGLRAGADDWITKPCHPEELLARIQAVLRRRGVELRAQLGGGGGWVWRHGAHGKEAARCAYCPCPVSFNLPATATCWPISCGASGLAPG